ncbi:MBL fold metallo-hydrolase [Spongiimicrobium sp. 3-5]|uniref:MBL fold metallo-hydrolase n=1 Tax=Spongiimicrobium sp. 3-5 TaxID=3332596 RepID=UPI00398031A8
MKYLKLLLLVYVLFTSCKDRIHTEDQSLDLLEKSTKGINIVKKSLELHGHLTDSLLQIGIAIVAEDGIHRGQSLVSEPPFERYKLETEFYIDRKNKLEVSINKNRFAGFDFIYIAVSDQDSVIGYDYNTKTYEKTSSVRFNRFRYFPQSYLTECLKTPSSITYDGIVNEQGIEYQVISSYFNGYKRNLYIDTETGLLNKVETLRNYEPYGDGVQTITFSDYLDVKQLKLPTKVSSGGYYGVWEDVVNHFNIVIKDLDENNIKGHKSMEDYTSSDYSYRLYSEVKKVSNNIYLIENITDSKSQWSYNILFVELENSVLVAEAPVNNDISKEAIDKIKEVIPNKPIKYLIQSHHHNDHWGGIREYMSLGVEIISTPYNSDLLKRIANTPFNLKPDSQSKNNKIPDIQIVDNELKISDKNLNIEIYNIGPTDHSNEMLIMYFPNEKVLWQADMINFGEWSLDNTLKKQLMDKISALNLEVETILGLHGKILSDKELNKIIVND